jgi:hypothetical protein
MRWTFVSDSTCHKHSSTSIQQDATMYLGPVPLNSCMSVFRRNQCLPKRFVRNWFSGIRTPFVLDPAAQLLSSSAFDTCRTRCYPDMTIRRKSHECPNNSPGFHRIVRCSLVMPSIVRELLVLADQVTTTSGFRIRSRTAICHRMYHLAWNQLS